MGTTNGLPAATYELLTTLQPWAKNPRRNADTVPRIAASLLAYGWGRPIIARRENREIIVGHTALKAAQWLSEQPPSDLNPDPSSWLIGPVRFVDLDEDQAHALAIADNRLGEYSEWDGAGLEATLKELQGKQLDLGPIGFTNDELEKLLHATGGGPDLMDPTAGGQDAEGETTVETMGFKKWRIPLTREDSAELERRIREYIEAKGALHGLAARMIRGI